MNMYFTCTRNGCTDVFVESKKSIWRRGGGTTDDHVLIGTTRCCLQQDKQCMNSEGDGKTLTELKAGIECGSEKIC